MRVVNLSDPQTFARVYDDHGASVYATAYRILADGARAQDVVQDVFLRLWRRPTAFDAQRGELGSYLRMMARSRALDLWRETRAAGRATDRMKVAVASDDGRPEERPSDAAELSDARSSVRAALGRLPESQREALVLTYWGGLTADEIARRSAVPLGTAKSRIRLGLAKLRSECGEQLALAAV